ncbi:hypothetical protein [Amycolatopsis cihanbeyliensis]|uniref:Uncharacterized protein n=1 Tax=Amycolatopsis cihanbeyliensis TaxID=1128664 RepID=A0A542DJL3_AMYCI|nr:hypothetical protein [Amycolatopsis cihanbeyliensis]TQJ03270.1 hypothetical protein FB471_3025 [Amycolatopsis cihanbeyliensis]
MGGRGGKGRAPRQPDHGPAEPLLPPEATARPEPPTEEPAEQPRPEQGEPSPTEQDDTGERADAGGLESRLLDAYTELASKPQDWIRLVRLREALGNPDHAELDQLLLSMTRTGLVHLAPDSNRKTLTDADHTAAIRIGSEHKHLIAIEPDYWDR